VDAAAKLQWLLDRRWLFDYQLRHEVLALIASTVSQVPTPLADAIWHRKGTAVPAGLTQHSRLLRDLTSQRIDRAPTAIAVLVGHLLTYTQPPFHDCAQVHRIIQEHGDVTGVKDIREQAIRLRCP
jgi:hypothetical protein